MNSQARITALMSSFGRTFHTENEVHKENHKETVMNYGKGE